MGKSLREIQGELEYSSVVMGQDRHQKRIRQTGLSGSKVGKKIAEGKTRDGDVTLQLLTDAIREHVKAVTEGKAWWKSAHIGYLVHIEPEQAAYITIRGAIDAAQKHGSLQQAAFYIANGIQDHIHLCQFETKAHPGLYKKVMESLKQCTSERFRQKAIQRVVKRYGAVDKLEWSQSDKLHLGTALLELFEQSADVIQLVTCHEGTNNTPKRVEFTEEAIAWISQANDKVGVYSPVHVPMVYPPRDWEAGTVEKGDGKSFFQITGGYLTDAMWRIKFIQNFIKGYETRLQETNLDRVTAAVNAVQATPWRINKGVQSVMEQLMGLPKYEHLFWAVEEELPPQPAEDAPDEVRKKWRIEASQAHGRNAKKRAKRVMTLTQRDQARKFAGFDAIYFPHRLDFRGRIYPYAACLHPQSDDLGKALLEFSRGKPLTARGLYWLKVHAANSFALEKIDKASFKDRVAWIDEHIEEVLDSGLRPTEGQMFWTEADKPWQALAACIEIAGATMLGAAAYVSHIPVGMDGSCSGLQHYSAALKDEVAGAEVNLVPRDRPGDIYTLVANTAQFLSDETSCDSDSLPLQAAWAGQIDRATVKQPIMTKCYAATPKGWESQILVSIGKKNTDMRGADPKKAARFLAKILDDACGKVVVAAQTGMEFLKGCAKVMNKAKLPIVWTAPNGFRVEQFYSKNRVKRVKVYYQGQIMKLNLVEPINVVDPQRQAQSIAPNFVHSLDSSHLMATVELGSLNDLHDWHMVHDCFGVHACDTDILHACIRESFVEQYSSNVFAAFREELEAQLLEHNPKLIKELPPLPAVGNLKIESVREAEYFFA